MKINLAKSAGFCFGVKRAIGIALKTASLSSKVYTLGDIVHNKDVLNQICKAGIKKMKKLMPGKNKILLICAHGVGKAIIQRARQLGYKVVDATCPMVKEIHRIAQSMEKQGYSIIVIGDKNHDEVYGILGQLERRAIIIDNYERIPWRKINRIKKAGIVVQSTQNLDKVLEIVEKLKPNFEKLKFFNTICQPTRAKQKEIRILPKNNDVVIIIGSRSSANTRRLYDISKSVNKNTYWIQNKKEINPKWFRKAKSVGITAGASTPDSTTQEVITYINHLI